MPYDYGDQGLAESVTNAFQMRRQNAQLAKKNADQKQFRDYAAMYQSAPPEQQRIIASKMLAVDPQGASQMLNFLHGQDAAATQQATAKEQQAAQASLYKANYVREAPDDQKLTIWKQIAPDHYTQTVQQLGRDPTPKEINQAIDLGLPDLQAKAGIKPDTVSATDKFKAQNALDVQNLRNKGAKELAAAKPAKPSFDSRHAELLAALAAQNVSVPVGLRSKDQLLATLNGLLTKYPDLSADEIATKIRSGIIDLGAEKKETTTAAALAGRTSVGEYELIDFIPKALAANAAVPRGSFVPYTKLKQVGEANISDGNLKELYGRTQAILNAYDIVSARGGTDMEKRAHNRKMLETADSPETYARAAGVLKDEAQIAQKAARKATRPFSERADEAPAGNPIKISSDAEFNALPSGAEFIGPDGKHRRKP